jgi:hypothetical protein
MSFFSWLRNRTSIQSARRDGVHVRPTTPRFRPQLESLEDRCVLSALNHHSPSPPPPPPPGLVTNTYDSGPGSLRYEIAAANPGDIITFAPSLDGHAITLTGGELDIDKNLTIQGPGAGLLTVTNGRGNNGSRIFEVDGSTVTLSGMTISNGVGVRQYIVDPAFGTDYYDGTGGGILNLGALTINGCTLSGNTAIGNSSHFFGGGGGGAVANFGTLTVSGCTLSNNSSQGGGGGIYNALGGTLTVSGCTLSGNSADGSPSDVGGGICNFGTLTVSNSTLSGNSASYGGGIANEGGTLTVSNSVFSANTPDNIEGPYTDGGGNTFN